MRPIVLFLTSLLVAVPAAAAEWIDPADADFSRAIEFASDRDPLTSVMIADADRILAQGHWRGGGARRGTNVKSVAKSVLSALVGIAIERGEIDSLATPVATWFPEHDELFDGSARARITLEDLLTMRSGLETTSFYNYGSWVAGRNWVRGQLRMPVEFEPGTVMRYSTGASHLVSVILERATGVKPRTYAARHLFGPLDAGAVGWDRDPQGHDFGGNNMSMNPRQMLRFGQMYLRGGEDVLPRDWIDRSWRVRTVSHWNGYGYGYFWWTRRMGGAIVHYAWGHGGQRVFVVPEAGIVVVTTAGLRSNGRSGGRVNRDIDRMLVEYVLGAMRRDS